MLSVVWSLQRALPLVALATALYAGYDLLTLGDWRRRPLAALARVWIFAILGLVAVESLIFASNPVLVLAYRLQVPHAVTQAGFLGSLLIAGLLWMRD